MSGMATNRFARFSKANENYFSSELWRSNLKKGKINVYKIKFVLGMEELL